MRKRQPDALELDLTDESGDRQFITALGRGLSLLRLLANGETLGTTDLAKLSGLSNATVSRLCYTLATLNYMEYMPEFGKYRLGDACLSLGYLYMASDLVSHVARPFMLELADFAHLPIGIGRRQGLNMLQIATEGAQDYMSLRQGVGSISPIERTAMGNAYLAGVDDALRKDLLAQLESRIPDMDAVRRQIDSNLELYEKRGFCMNDRTWLPHIRAVGVPLRMRDTGSVVAFNCGGIADLIDADYMMNEVGPRLADLVRKVEQILEFQMVTRDQLKAEF